VARGEEKAKICTGSGHGARPRNGVRGRRDASGMMQRVSRGIPGRVHRGVLRGSVAGSYPSYYVSYASRNSMNIACVFSEQ
jgi:hypothetical protein